MYASGMSSLAAILVLLTIPVAASAATVGFYDDPLAWAAAQTSSGYFRLDEQRLEPVLGELVDNQNLGPQLTLPLSPGGQTVLETVQPEYDFVFTKAPVYPLDCLDIGYPRGDSKPDDDWEISAFGQPVYGFGADILDNDEPTKPDGMETFSVLSGGEWHSISKGDPGLSWPQGLNAFIGAVSDEPIERVLWDDGAANDNIGLGGLYTGLPEPGALTLLVIGGAVVLACRRGY